MKREGDMPGAVDIRIEYGVRFIGEGRSDINQVLSRACHTTRSLELTSPYERVSCGRRLMTMIHAAIFPHVLLLLAWLSHLSGYCPPG